MMMAGITNITTATTTAISIIPTLTHVDTERNAAQKGMVWAPHFCVCEILRFLDVAMRPDRFSMMRRGG